MAKKSTTDIIDQLERQLELKDQEIISFKKELYLLNEQIEDLIEKLSAQVQFANKIQEKLVPTEIPSISGFDFSNKFIASPISGGDYFDIFEIEDKFRFSILLSSCSGYGLSSLFLTILLKLSMHIETKKGAAPEKVVSMVLDELSTKLSDKDTAHLFYGLVNKRNYEMTYCHVGNNYITHYIAEKKSAIEIESFLPPITKKYKKKLSSKSIVLNPKDKLIFISEGIYSISNSNGIQFPREKILEILEGSSRSTVHEIRNEIVFQIQKWSHKKDLPKDLTVLVAEVKERVLKLA